MAAVMTATRVNYPNGKGSRIICDWTSHTDGTVSLSICTKLGYTSGELIGLLRAVETAPGASGDLANDLPTSYGLTLKDAYSLDWLDGAGAARSATAAELITFIQPLLIMSDLTVGISSAGSGKKGRLILYFGPEV